MASSPAFIASMMASICGSVVGDVLMLESCVTVEAPKFVDSVLMMGPSDVLKERPPAVDRRLVLSFNSVTVLLGSCLGIVLRCSVLLKKLVLPSVLVLASCSVLLERLVLPPGVVLIIVLLARVVPTDPACVPPLVLLLMLLVVLVVDKEVDKVVDKEVDKEVDKDWRAASAASYFSVSTAITLV